MHAVTDLDLPVFDYTDPTLTGERFHTVMDGLRAQSWVARVEPLGYVVLAHDAVDAVLRTRGAKMPATEILALQGVTEGPIYDQLSGNLLDLHGDEHRRLRMVVQPAFLPRVAESLRPAMRAHLETLFAPVAATGRCEFVSAVAKPYPARMIAEVMGAPITDAAQLGEWAYWIQSTFDPTKIAGEPARIEEAAVAFDGYVRRLLRERDPGGDEDDLLATLLAAGLTEDECVTLASAVLIGGVDTTQAQLAHGVRLFVEHPEQWQALVADHDLASAAVDELLRYEPITPFTARLATEDVIHRDVCFPAGSVIFACTLTANHDPQVYAAPEVFDITADRGAAKPLTFGAGPHFCLGASLARVELEEALVFLAEHAPRLERDGAPVFDTPSGVYGLTALPLRLGGGVTAASA